jgi:hypothetical protein
MVLGCLALVVLEEGLAQVGDSRGPQTDEDARLPPAADEQVEREQDRYEGAPHVDSLCRAQDQPPNIVSFAVAHYTLARNR